MADNINKDSGRAVIESGDIVIRVSIAALGTITNGVGALWNPDGNPTVEIVDVEEFAKDLVYELNNEAEDGTTRVHTMFDDAIEAAILDGAQGVEDL